MKTIKQSSFTRQNLGIGDRMFRYVVGSGLIGLFMAYAANGNRYDELLATLALVSIIIIASAIIRWDPVYAILGINTIAKTKEKIRSSVANVGMIDSAVRLAIGSSLIGGFLLFSPTPVGWTAILPLLAIPVMATAIMGWCPLYSLSNVNTTRTRLRKTKILPPGFTGPTLPRSGRTKTA